MLRKSLRAGIILPAAFVIHACSDGPSEPPVPASLQVNGTVPGTAVVGSALTPSVRVTDSRGQPVAGSTVTFAVTTGGGSVANASASSNNAGIASPGAWTLGTTAGANTLVATFGSLAPVTIVVNTTAAPASDLVRLSAETQTATVGAAVLDPPSVRAQDQYGNVVAGATVTFAVTSGGGTVTGATQVTNTAGIATVDSWTAGTAPGENTLTASIAGSASISFTATGVVASPAAAIAPAAGNAVSGTAGTLLDPDPGVIVTDESGSPVAGVQVAFSAGAGSGSVTGGVQTTGADGIARPTGWTLGEQAGTQTLNAAAGALATVVTVDALAGPAVSLVPVSVTPQSADAGAAATSLPSVRAEDQFGNVVAGTTVTFAVAAGGGSITGATPATDAAGLATVGSWTLGATPGTNQLTATTAAGGSASFSAVGLDASGLAIDKLAGDGTTCPINRDGCVFSVKVSQAGGLPAAGETVIWSNGSGTTINTMTNIRGIATTGNIAPNSVIGARTQTATLQTSGTQVTFDYDLVADAGYNIDIRYIGPTPTAAVQAAFAQAGERWEVIITGDLPNVQLQSEANACQVIDHPAINEIIDDLLVLVVVDSIDGASKILGSAGPCFVRSSSNLPVVGIMRLDSADLAVLEDNGSLQDVITHELGHTLGSPTLWGEGFFDLLQDSATENAYFSGVRGAADFVVAGGTLVNGIGVPVENTGGGGTRNGHWRESVLSDELMTGFISGSDNPLSRITIGSLMDIGYEVNFGAADSYLLPGASLRAGGSNSVVRLELRELPMPRPRVVR